MRLFLIITFFLMQSCSNTLIGKKLENSFDLTESPETSVTSNSKPQKFDQKINIKSRKKDDEKDVKNNFDSTIKKKSISNKVKQNQRSTKSIKRTIFNPQPYRIILRLSGANPSAPAETVTEALRKAGVQFEVEKIERFVEEDLTKNISSKR